MFGKSSYFGLRGRKLEFAIAIIAGLDFFLFGYDQGVTGGLLTLPSFTSQFPEIDVPASGSPDYIHASTIQGITVGSYNLGCLTGAVMTIWLGDMLGRRRMIFLGSSIMVIGAILQCSSYSIAQLIVGRLITGMGNGMNTSTVPTWQSETSRSHKRGKMVMIEGAMITGGVCFSYWLDYGFYYTDANHGSLAWRFPLGFQIFFASILVLLILELPESPRWLLLKGKDEEALNVMAALRDRPTDDKEVRTEFVEVKDSVLELSQYGFRDLFTQGDQRVFHRVVLGYVNQVFQQISGINLITYYAAQIYQNIGLSANLARLLAALNGTEYFLASFVAVWTIERFGRRKLMLFGAIGQACSMAILAGVTSRVDVALGWVAVAFLFVFNTFFAIGWLGMTWLYPAEIVPLHVRAPSNALSTSANWAFNFMVVMVTPVSFATIGYQTYIIFAVINAFIVPCVYFFYPETAYRSLEEMDAIFQKTKGVFNVVSTAKHEPRRYGKNGELLVDYEASDERAARRNSSAAVAHRRASKMDEEKPVTRGVENIDDTSSGEKTVT